MNAGPRKALIWPPSRSHDRGNVTPGEEDRSMTADMPGAPTAADAPTVAAPERPAAPAAPATTTPPRQDAAVSPASRRAYDADWAVFQAWCRATGHAPLPADAEMLARYLSDPALTRGAPGLRGPQGRRPGPRRRGTVDRCLAAIAHAHRARGLAAPTDDPAMRQRLRATKRQIALISRPRRPTPRPAQLTRTAAACLSDLAGMRDRALLLLAAAGLGRAALVGLDFEQVRLVPTAVELTLRAADPDGDTVRRRVVPCGPTLSVCPFQALRDWLRASDTRC